MLKSSPFTFFSNVKCSGGENQSIFFQTYNFKLCLLKSCFVFLDSSGPRINKYAIISAMWVSEIVRNIQQQQPLVSLKLFNSSSWSCCYSAAAGSASRWWGLWRNGRESEHQLWASGRLLSPTLHIGQPSPRRKGKWKRGRMINTYIHHIK
jgi:hypothetical protein